MDATLLGETLASDDNGIDFLGFWMEASGSEGTAAVRVFAAAISDQIKVRLETKSSNEDDSAAGSVGTVTITSATPQIHRFDVADARDLVRYVVKIKGENAADFAHLQVLAPTWAPN